MPTKDDYDKNIVYDGEIELPYILITKEYEPGSIASNGVDYWEIGDIYQFATKRELAEAMKVIEGIPAQTLEAKVVHTVALKKKK